MKTLRPLSGAMISRLGPYSAYHAVRLKVAGLAAENALGQVVGGVAPAQPACDSQVAAEALHALLQVRDHVRHLVGRSTR